MNALDEEEIDENRTCDFDNNNRNDLLDNLISDNEVLYCIKKLKNNKASGLDNIANEFLKTSAVKMLGIYVKLFNLILITGNVPSDWVMGIIQPIF